MYHACTQGALPHTSYNRVHTTSDEFQSQFTLRPAESKRTLSEACMEEYISTRSSGRRHFCYLFPPQTGRNRLRNSSQRGCYTSSYIYTVCLHSGCVTPAPSCDSKDANHLATKGSARHYCPPSVASWPTLTPTKK